MMEQKFAKLTLIKDIIDESCLDTGFNLQLTTNMWVPNFDSRRGDSEMLDIKSQQGYSWQMIVVTNSHVSSMGIK